MGTAGGKRYSIHLSVRMVFKPPVFMVFKSPVRRVLNLLEPPVVLVLKVPVVLVLEPPAMRVLSPPAGEDAADGSRYSAAAPGTGQHKWEG